MQLQHVCSGAAAMATSSGSFVEKKFGSIDAAEAAFCQIYESTTTRARLCDTPNAARRRSSSPTTRKFEVGELVVAGGWAEATPAAPNPWQYLEHYHKFYECNTHAYANLVLFLGGYVRYPSKMDT